MERSTKEREKEEGSGQLVPVVTDLTAWLSSGSFVLFIRSLC